MDIQRISINNEPKFGMGFIKPENEEELIKFTKSLYKGSYGSKRRITRGLKRFEKKHENNPHVDIKCGKNGAVLLVPKSPEAKKYFVGYAISPLHYPTKTARLIEQMAHVASDVDKNGSLLDRIIYGIKLSFKVFKSQIDTFINPVESLPSTLRRAGDQAKIIADEIGVIARKSNKN